MASWSKAIRPSSIVLLDAASRLTDEVAVCHHANHETSRPTEPHIIGPLKQGAAHGVCPQQRRVHRRGTRFRTSDRPSSQRRELRAEPSVELIDCRRHQSL